MVEKYNLESLTLLKASFMFPASSVVARLSELMTDPKSSKFVLISTGKLLSCITVDGKRLSKKTTATSAEINSKLRHTRTI